MIGVQWLDPKGLWLLTEILPLVVFYLLKMKRRRARVPSTWLWAAAQRDLLARHPLRRLTPELALLLQIVALVALAAALARPTTRGKRIDVDHVAIVVDTSASMSTSSEADGAMATRIVLAQKAALDVVARLEPGAEAIVIEAARAPRVVCPFERAAQRLESAIGGLAAQDVEGDLQPAIALAADRLRALSGRRRIVLLTDGALAHAAPLAASGVPVEIITVGDTRDNAGIVRLDVRSGLDPATHREQVQVFAMLRSWGDRPREAFVTLTMEGASDPIASRRLLLRPEEKTPVVLSFEPRDDVRGKGLVVQLSPGDAFATDDMAFARVPPSPKMPVVTAAEVLSRSWLDRALQADESLDLRRLTLAQLETANVDPDALVVVESACPTRVPGRDVLVVAPPPGRCFGVDVGAAIETPAVTSWESSDPRLRFLSLDGVHVAQSASLQSSGAGARLVQSVSTSLLVDASTSGRAITVLGFEPGQSDWPLQASFVLFIRNVVELARQHREQASIGMVRTGEPLRIAVPLDVTSVALEAPQTAERTLAARDGLVVGPVLERAGLYRVHWSFPHMGETIVAANLTSELESDVRRREIAVDGSTATATNASAAKSALDTRSDLVAWFALAAALALALDIWWLTRGVRRPRHGQQVA
jgi:hypothetical protein